MSSEGDASPISALAQSFQYATSPVDASGFDNSPNVGISELGKSTESLTKRPFLKRGSRMPKSKIPVDPFTPVVAAIKNPPKLPSVADSEVGAHDLLRPRFDEKSPAKPNFRPVTAPAVARRAAARPPSVYGAEGWAELATKRTEDLETFLRNEEEHHVPSFRRQRGGVTDHNKESGLPSAASTTHIDHASDISVPESAEKLATLDAQIAKFRKENEYCKKLRLERETALGEAQRYKERALRELEAAEKDIAEQRALIVAERRKAQTDRDRGRSVVAQLRELSEENRILKQRLSETESESTAKLRKMKNEIARLNACVADLQRAKFELDLELKGRHVDSSQVEAPSKSLSYTGFDDKSHIDFDGLDHIDRRVSLKDISSKSSDSGKETVFPSGLRKTVWPNGAALVCFPNGDVKETTAEGVVIYRYSATGCTQTTYSDREVLQFSSGQVENHFKDGSKEITFPNGSMKRIDKDGIEII